MNSMKKRNESGFVAIIITALIMVILALITLGFARFMQREQRQALDRQLSRQALYAAETGINDTLSYLANSANSEYTGESTCEETANVISGNNGVIDPSNPDVEYTCILFDQSPGSLTYQLASNQSKLVELNAGVNTFTEVTFNWSSSSPNGTLPNCSAAANFEPSRSGTPVLKIDLTSLANYSRDSLRDNSAYIYAAPCHDNPGGSGATYSFDPSRRGDVVPVNCTALGACSLTIENLSSSRYLARFKSIYSESNVSIEGQYAGGSVQFNGAQREIDVTARAGDVIRRLRVSVATQAVAGDTIPEAVFQAEDGFCKLNYYNTSGPGYTYGDACLDP